MGLLILWRDAADPPLPQKRDETSAGKLKGAVFHSCAKAARQFGHSIAGQQKQLSNFPRPKPLARRRHEAVQYLIQR